MPFQQKFGRFNFAKDNFNKNNTYMSIEVVKLSETYDDHMQLREHHEMRWIIQYQSKRAPGHWYLIGTNTYKQEDKIKAVEIASNLISNSKDIIATRVKEVEVSILVLINETGLQDD